MYIGTYIVCTHILWANIYCMYISTYISTYKQETYVAGIPSVLLLLCYIASSSGLVSSFSKNEGIQLHVS